MSRASPVLSAIFVSITLGLVCATAIVRAVAFPLVRSQGCLCGHRGLPLRPR